MRKWFWGLGVLCLLAVGVTGIILSSHKDVPAYQEETIVTEDIPSEEIQENIEGSEVDTEVTENVSEESEPENGTTEGSDEVTEDTEDYVEETETALEVTESNFEDTEPDETENTESIVALPQELSVDTVIIDLPGVTGSYDLLFVNDLHILTVDESVIPEQESVAANRYENMFRGPGGRYSPETWTLFYNHLDNWQADAVVFGGDMLDFISAANKSLLQEGLNHIQTPYLYLRADHDLGTWYSGGLLSSDDAYGMQAEIAEYTDMFVVDMGEFYILGWNNSTSQLSEGGLMTATDIWDDGKPIILATHVPIASAINSDLEAAAAAADPHGRVKLWGDGYLYQPNDITGTFLNMLYAEESPVKAILSGHLHFKFTTSVTAETVEYVFAPSFAGNMAHIKIQ